MTMKLHHCVQFTPINRQKTVLHPQDEDINERTTKQADRAFTEPNSKRQRTNSNQKSSLSYPTRKRASRSKLEKTGASDVYNINVGRQDQLRGTNSKTLEGNLEQGNGGSCRQAHQTAPLISQVTLNKLQSFRYSSHKFEVQLNQILEDATATEEPSHTTTPTIVSGDTFSLPQRIPNDSSPFEKVQDRNASDGSLDGQAFEELVANFTWPDVTACSDPSAEVRQFPDPFEEARAGGTPSKDNPSEPPEVFNHPKEASRAQNVWHPPCPEAMSHGFTAEALGFQLNQKGWEDFDMSATSSRTAPIEEIADVVARLEPWDEDMLDEDLFELGQQTSISSPSLECASLPAFKPPLPKSVELITQQSSSVIPAQPKPFIRGPFPSPVLMSSPICGLVSRPLRICFRIGQAIQALNLANSQITLELYAIVASSSILSSISGSQVLRVQEFKFVDLFFPDRPPHLSGSWKTWDQNAVVKADSSAFLDFNGGNWVWDRDHGEEPRMARVIARLDDLPVSGRPAPAPSDQLERRLTILSIWRTDWTEVELAKKLVSE